MSTHESNRPICYVCGRPVKTKPIHISSDLCRHQSCEPGSKKFMKNVEQRNLFLKNCFPSMTWDEYKKEVLQGKEE